MSVIPPIPLPERQAPPLPVSVVQAAGAASGVSTRLVLFRANDASPPVPAAYTNRFVL